MLRQGPVSPPPPPLLELELAGWDSLVKPAYSMDPLSPPYWWSPYPRSVNVSVEELNSGPHSCGANPLLTEPSLRSVDFQLDDLSRHESRVLKLLRTFLSGPL